jgi:hypothetical protein
MSARLCHLEAWKTLFLTLRQGPTEFHAQPVRIRELYELSTGKLSVTPTRKFKNLQPSALGKAPIHELFPIQMLTQDFVSRNKILNVKVNRNRRHILTQKSVFKNMNYTHVVFND